MLGKKLRELREKAGLTQQQLADLVNLSQQTIGHYEVGRARPDTDTLELFADLFATTTDYLLGRSDTKTSTPQVYVSEEVDELLEHLHKRPEMKTLFSVSKKATKEDIERAVKIIEALKGDE